MCSSMQAAIEHVAHFTYTWNFKGTSKVYLRNRMILFSEQGDFGLGNQLNNYRKVQKKQQQKDNL